MQWLQINLPKSVLHAQSYFLVSVIVVVAMSLLVALPCQIILDMWQFCRKTDDLMENACENWCPQANRGSSTITLFVILPYCIQCSARSAYKQGGGLQLLCLQKLYSSYKPLSICTYLYKFVFSCSDYSLLGLCILPWRKIREISSINNTEVSEKVKNSSPKKLLVDCRPTVGQLLANSPPTVGQLLFTIISEFFLPTFGHVSAIVCTNLLIA